jgi:hypothetical protein
VLRWSHEDKPEHTAYEVSPGGFRVYFLPIFSCLANIIQRNWLVTRLQKIGTTAAGAIDKTQSIGGSKMKKVLSTLVAALVAVAFAGVVFAAEPAKSAAPAAPAAAPAAAEPAKEEKKPAKKKKAKKAKKAEKKEEAAPAAAEPAKK